MDDGVNKGLDDLENDVQALKARVTTGWLRLSRALPAREPGGQLELPSRLTARQLASHYLAWLKRGLQ